jgi:pyrroline-5-carboxylate reductase
MGEAIISGLLKSSVYHPQEIKGYDINQNRCRYITQHYRVECADKIRNALAFADVCIIAVKPNDMAQTLEQIGPVMTPEKMLISIAAGVTLGFYQKHLPDHVPVVRVMPNIAVSVCESMTVLSPSKNVSLLQLKTATDILGLLGRVMQMDEEHLNSVTGIVGSGAAYVFLFIDALADAGVRLGLSREVALKLAAQTTFGASKMVLETGEHPGKLKDLVATPAGATVEGLLELERGALRATVISAVSRAAERARVLASQT